MKINDIINEDAERDARYVRQFKQKKIERELRSLAGKLRGALQSVSVQFAGHFAERMIDDRNDPKITLDELEAFIRKIDASDEMQSNLAKAGAEGIQAVVHEIKSKLNVPFMIRLLPDGPDANDIPDLKLIPKTIMRKANFGTSGPKFNMENIQAPLFKKALSEGGAMPGVGPIHINEIEPTLRALEKDLGIDLVNNTLGSVGKKEFSGDIDVALKIDAEDIPEFMERLKSSPLILDMEKTSVIMTKLKIVNYNDSLQTNRGERTGYVQLDFMPGDPAWLKTYYHAPSETESQYKGAHRNAMLAIIAANWEQHASEEKTEDGRPLRVERWMWSPRDGLVRIERTPVPKAKGDGYTKKNKNEIIGEPIRTKEGIVKALNLGSVDSLNSYESLLTAVEQNYPDELVAKIKEAIPHNEKFAGYTPGQ